MPKEFVTSYVNVVTPPLVLPFVKETLSPKAPVFVGVTQVPSPRKKVVAEPPLGTIPNVEPPPYISAETKPFDVTLKCAELKPATPFSNASIPAAPP